jgi:outer membrane protein, multidrug efflux system
MTTAAGASVSFEMVAAGTETASQRRPATLTTVASPIPLTRSRSLMTMPAIIRTFGPLGLAAALALSGCTGLSKSVRVRPDPAVTALPAMEPGIASAKLATDVAIDRWWTLFADPLLDRLMDEALAHNEDLEAAFARVREAQANLDIAAAAQSPTLELQTQASRAQQSEASSMPLPPGVDRRSSRHVISLSAGYEIDLWGKLSSATAAARSQLLSTEWARASVEWSVTAKLAEAYFGLAAVDRQIEISEAVRRSRETTVALRRREYDAGAGNEFDLRRAEAELTATEATIASLARQRLSLTRALTALLGRTPNEIVTGTLARTALDERETPIVVLPRGAAAELLVRRPDIRQVEAQLDAANASIDAARAATLPSVRLSGILGTDAKSIANLFSGPALIWTLAASVTQSIIDGGKAKARVREEHARAEQVLASYRQVVASAVLDVHEAYGALETTEQAFRAERGRVASLARARELARLGYDNGALSYLDLLDADRNWHQAQLSQVTAYRDRLVAQVAAYRALGGGHAGVDPHARIHH